ncbi:MAG TPA: AAA family ATPase [Gemmataceae bacterium]|nr:AAA family ATPase [Gemmataceae bacterium]
MQVAVLIQDISQPLGIQLREMLQARLHCLEPKLIAFDQAEEVLARSPVNMLVVALSPSPDLALDLLRKIRFQSSGPVLAVGLASDSKLILRALHEGADHYLDEADLEKQLDSVLLRLQIKEEAARQPTGQVISFLGASGGSGASTLAVNLAGVLARDLGRCALIDLKPGVGDLAALLDLKPTHNLADLCLNVGRMDRSMLDSALVPHASGVHLLAPPLLYEDIRLVTAQGVMKTLHLVRDAYRFIVVDLEDSFHEEQLIVLRQADYVLLVLRLDFTSLRSTKRILANLEQAGIRSERVRLVINRYGQAKELPLSEAEEALGQKIAFLIPDDPKSVNAANNAGEPVVFRTPSAKVTQSIVQMANAFVNPEEAKLSSVRQAVKSVNGWLAVFHG